MRRINSAKANKIREAVYKQYSGKCAYCRTPASYEHGTVDHLLPYSLGGTNARYNLRWCCKPCNSRKANMHPADWLLYLNPQPESVMGK